MPNLSGKKIAMLIAFEGFRDEEYDLPKKSFEEAGISVTTASTQVGTATGKFGLKAKTDTTFDKIRAEDFDAVVFIGGPGCYAHFKNTTLHKLAQNTLAKNKVLASICASPGILAHAGVLKGRKATVFPSEAELIKEKGANYTGKPVEVDGNLITADGPQSAKKFAEEIIKKML
jgi:protease I